MANKKAKKVIKPDKASLGIAIIARNAEKTIGACLDSIVPYAEQVVVCVDETSTDKTASEARKHGAEVHVGHKVSWPHACLQHGNILAQHFADARQASFAHLRKDLSFHGWIDADDIVFGGEKIAGILRNLHPDIVGVWLPYHYSRVGADGPTTTLFDRERFVRSNLPWKWQHRVHEILVPVGKETEHLAWTRTDAVKIVHQHVGHDTAGSARRNITLLEIDLENDKSDMRSWFYLGNQYFALADWPSAAECYMQATQSDNPYQLWQTLNYLGKTYEQMNDTHNAQLAYFRALQIKPNHAEPYYGLASTYMRENNLEHAEFWTSTGDSMQDPPNFVFRNPLDKPYNARLTMATAYANAGFSTRARIELEQAARVVPSKEILDGIELHKKLEEDAQTADAWVRVLSGQEQIRRNGISDDIWRFGRIRDVIVPHIIAGRASTQPRIIFFCNRSIEPWAPPSINTTGIGGSETAVVQIARRFAQAGWRVDVYNDCDHFEGEYDNVGYWNCERLQQGESTDVLVSWRDPNLYDIPVQRQLSLLWCHDLHSGPGVEAQMAKWDRVLGVSEWHRDYLSQVYSLNNTDFVPNGIDLERFKNPVKKIPFRCVWASSPDRGLPNLLRMWADIVSNEPTAELHVAYGWNNVDRLVSLGMDKRGGLAELKRAVETLVEHTPGVVWRGRLPQDELAKLYQESYCLLYPTAFTETYCIVAVEAMAAGCVPVVSSTGALPATVGDGGLVVVGNTYTQAWKDFYVLCARSVLQGPMVRNPLMQQGIERSKTMTWDHAYDRWAGITTALLERKEAVHV